MSEFAGMNVLVVGLGSSGEAAARALRALEARPVVIDSSASPSRADAADSLRSDGIEVRLAVDVPGDLSSFDLVVASPGVPDAAPVLSSSRSEGLGVISELELGYRLLEKNTIVAVTGTNGKTTTTRMIAEMLDRPGRRAIPCGNIGTPIASLHGNVGETDVLVIEVSSFQLQNIERFHARVAVILNLAPDHFDWHRDMDEYARAKTRIVENMEAGEKLVYKIDDPFCRQVASLASGTPIGFGTIQEEGSGIWLEEGWIVAGSPLPSTRLLRVEDLMVTGLHNVENVMAAAAASLALGEDPERIGAAALGFEGLEHRCEPAGEIDGVAFFNDSKATNPHATLHAVKSFEGRFVVIMGGRNKGLDFAELAGTLCSLLEVGRLQGIVLLGESAAEIKAAVEKTCARATEGRLVVAESLQDSISRAFSLTGRGGAVLFSPACASFDMFTDYKERGRAFKEAVGRLARGGDSGGVT